MVEKYSVLVPSQLDMEGAIELEKRLNSAPLASEYSIDFRRLGFAYPFGMLYSATVLKRFVTKHVPARSVHAIYNPDNEATSYAQHMGFFQAANFRLGNVPGQAIGSPTYLPITYQNTGLLKSRSEILQLARRLAIRLTQSHTGTLVDALTYAFREIIRNVVEHSQASQFGYCAQYWPRKALVEIAILDIGEGLSKTLSNNPHLSIENDHDAIMYALAPGVSGKVYDGVQLTNDEWQNSGFGLYLTQRLCTQGGSFFICSGSTGLYRTKGSKTNNYYETTFDGTALCLQLNAAAIKNPKGMIEQYVREGEEIARQAKGGAIPSASSISKMIRSDFAERQITFVAGDHVRHLTYGVGIVHEVINSPSGHILRVLFNGGRKTKVHCSKVTKERSSESEYSWQDDFWEAE